MKAQNMAAVMAAAAAVSVANSQAPVGAFAGPTESFESMAASAYLSFPGWAGGAIFSRIGVIGGLVVNATPAILPPFSGKQEMFGKGADVRIKFAGVHKKFGGRFRTPWAGVPVTWMRVFFYKAGVLVGVPVGASVNTLGWLWHGWDLGSLGGYDEVRIFGNGTKPGFVGMDCLVYS